MKKINLSLLFLALPLLTFAQGNYSARLGIKAGANLSKMTIQNEPESGTDASSFKFGYSGGGFLEISGASGSKFKGQIEVLYNRYNFQNTYTTTVAFPVATSLHLNQLSIPLLAKYYVIPSLSINMGVSVNFNLNGKGQDELVGFDFPNAVNFNVQDINGFSRVQVGALAGISYYLYKGLFLDARYNYYFGKIVDAPIDYMFDFKKVNAFQLGIGYRF